MKTVQEYLDEIGGVLSDALLLSQRGERDKALTQTPYSLKRVTKQVFVLDVEISDK